MQQQTLIIGAGHAAGQLAASLRQQGYAGRIVMLGEEPYPPYQRPPLSKKFLSGELPAERLFLKPAAFYDDHDIEIRTNARVSAIDRGAKTLTTEDGASLAYSTLVFATGGRAIRLACPGADLPGVHYLRNIEDVERIRADRPAATRVVIVGAGYIGLEVAAVLRESGLDVVVLETAERVLSRVVSPPVSEFFERIHRERGVELKLSTSLESFDGDERVRAAITTSGERIDADLAVVGIGIRPNTELAAEAGLAVDDGIVVDAYCRTADPDIYAIGDCTRHPNATYQRSLRLESVQNALEQAKTAAANITGNDARYDEVPWFWSDQYHLKLQIAGLSHGFDDYVMRGDPTGDGFACAYLRDGRLIAIDCVNSPKDFMMSKALIRDAREMDRARLADASISIRDVAKD